MITGLHHAQITVPTGAEAEARRFYCGVLGLPEIEKPPGLRGRGGLWLRVGDREVHVGTEDGGVDRATTKAHPAYAVTDVGHWRRRLEAAGVRPLESVPIGGYDRFEARDPFGNRIEFIQRLSSDHSPPATNHSPPCEPSSSPAPPASSGPTSSGSCSPAGTRSDTA